MFLYSEIMFPDIIPAPSPNPTPLPQRGHLAGKAAGPWAGRCQKLGSESLEELLTAGMAGVWIRMDANLTHNEGVVLGGGCVLCAGTH